jgi:hypothetical protein
MSMSGGCLCGAVRYEVSGEPVTMRVCWCKDCQRLAAGNGAANILFHRDAIKVTGTPATFSKQAESGNVIDRKFCANCGTQMFGETAARPNFVVVRAGTLDDPSIFKPVAYIWTISAPSWVCMDEAIPKFEKQAPPPPPSK